MLPNHPPSLSHRVQKTVLYICVSFSSGFLGVYAHQWDRWVIWHSISSFYFYCDDFYFIIIFLIFNFFLHYNIVLVLPYINMHLPWVYMYSPS